MSLYEKRAFELLDRMVNVIQYEVQPFSISYSWLDSRHEYIPDILVSLGDGSMGLIEVKPSARLVSPRVTAKSLAAREFCRERGWFFEVWTEKDLFSAESNGRARFTKQSR